MVPRNASRAIGLKSCVLNGHAIESPHTLLLHGHSVQVTLATLTGTDGLAELLTGVEHALVHPHPLPLGGLLLLPAEEEPGAVDGPVAEVAQAGHAERRGRRREHVSLEDVDAGVVLGADGSTLVSAGGAAADLGCFGALGGFAEERRGCGEEADGGHGCVGEGGGDGGGLAG